MYLSTLLSCKLEPLAFSSLYPHCAAVLGVMPTTAPSDRTKGPKSCPHVGAALKGADAWAGSYLRSTATETNGPGQVFSLSLSLKSSCTK